MTEEPAALAASVGRRLRARRTELRWTLAETARRADVSVSYLSSIEVGNAVPSLPILARVAAALELTLNEALRGLGRNAIEAGQLDPARAGVTRPATSELELRIALLVAEPGEAGGCPVPVRGGEVFVHVVGGDLAVTVDGEEHELHAGDSLDAEAPATVGYRAGEQGRAVSVWASAPASEPRARA